MHVKSCWGEVAVADLQRCLWSRGESEVSKRREPAESGCCFQSLKPRLMNVEEPPSGPGAGVTNRKQAKPQKVTQQVSVRVCVCVRERERDRERDRQRDSVCVCACVCVRRSLVSVSLHPSHTVVCV